MFSFVVPLNTLEPYERDCPESHYQLTTESFAIVASTFVMRLPMPAEAAAIDTAGPIHPELSDGIRSQSARKVATTRSEPQLGSGGPTLANTEPSAKLQSESERDSERLIIALDLDNPESTHDKKSNLQRYIKPGQFTTLVSAAFTCDATTTLKIFTELVDAHKVTRLAFTETKQEKSPGVSDTVGES